MSRIGTIFAWAVLAATVGTILKAIQENSGFVGKIITGLVGIVWNIATFFVVPILAYENVGPIDALKRSSKMMKDKWGESLGSNMSMGLVGLLIGICIAAVGILLAVFIHPIAGIAVGVTGFLLLSVVMSAAQTIFVSAVYHNITGTPTQHFNEKMLDGLFIQK